MPLLLFAIYLFLPLYSSAMINPDIWSCDLVNTLTGEVRFDMPLPVSASDLRKQFRRINQTPSMVVFEKQATIYNLDESVWRFEGEAPILSQPAALGSSHYMYNYRLYYDSLEDYYTLQLAGNRYREYRASANSGKYLLTYEQYANGECCKLSYDKRDRLLQVEVWAKEHRLSYLTYRYEGETVTVEGSDKLSICYQLEQSGLSYENVSYIYQEGLPIRYSRADGYYIDIEYLHGKAHKIFAPLGVDNRPVLMASYRYEESATTVTDAMGAITRYEFDKNHLVAKKKYDLEGSLYRVEKFHWSQKGFLEECSVHDASDTIAWQCILTNDSYGNVLSESIGDLHRVFTYDRLHRIRKKQCGETEVHFEYVEETDLVEKKQIFFRETMRMQYLYRYDRGQVVECIFEGDQGERRVFNLYYAGNKPLVLDEKYFDPESGEEKIQNTTVLQYNAQGRVEARHLVDSQGECYHTTRYRYDREGRIVSLSKEGEGVEQYRYDLAGRVTQMRSSSLETTKKFSYDLAGRLVAVVIDKGGDLFHENFRYNFLGQLICKKDTFGHQTTYEYDEFGRRVKTLFPLQERGYPTILQRYDVCNNLIEITDPNGDVTSIRYNSQAKPTYIGHADGTFELCDYSPEGYKHTVNGVAVDYEIDFLGRVTKKTVSASYLEPVISLASYNAFGISSVTESGVKKEYERDASGRVYALTTQWKEGSARVHYEQGSQPTVVEKWCDLGSSQIEVNTVELVEEIEKNLVDYPSANQKENYQVERDFHFINKRAERVLQVTTTNDRGVKEVTTYNTLGRIEEQSRYDCFSQLSTIKLSYDLAGNVVEQNYNGEVTRYSYGPCGKMVKITEHADSKKASSTFYEYDELGQLIVQRADGKSLFFCYDAMGRVQRIFSSDQSVDYSYEYDHFSRPVSIEDHVSGQKSYREYHSLGMVTKDCQANELEIVKSYDLQGRLCTLTLPDRSAIRYIYSEGMLKKVERLDSDGTILYDHEYTKMDSMGRPLCMRLPKKSGSVSLKWDEGGGCIEINSKWWNQRIVKEGGDVVSSYTRDLEGEYIAHYSYDCNGQLIEESGTTQRGYSYDSFNNRIEGLQQHIQNESGEVTTRFYRGERQQLYYDALHRLNEVRVEDRPIVSYRYDAFNRRLSKSIYLEEGSKTLRYLYDGDREIGAVDERGEIVELKILAHNAAIAVEIDNELYVPIQDFRGNIGCLLDSKGVAVECYRYSAFGEEIESKQPLSPWRFGSKRIEEQTGLIHYGYRDYDPSAGRWITADPSGRVDGINRHLFVHNNPLSFIDPNGLFSIRALWQGVFQCVDHLSTLTKSLSFYRANIMVSLLNNIVEEFHIIANETIGPTLFLLSGLSKDPVEFGVVGEGEFNDKVRISHVNGVLNDREGAIEAASLISHTHGGVNVHYTFRPTAGWTGDISALIPTLLGWTSPTAKRLAQGWKELIEEMGGVGGGGMIIHYAHSLGGAETACAKRLMSKEQLAMIRVTTFGSAKVLADRNFSQVRNYVSSLDLIALGADIMAYFQAATHTSNVIFLDHAGAFPVVDDHKFCGPVYSVILEELGRRFVALYDPKDRDSVLINKRDGA